MAKTKKYKKVIKQKGGRRISRNAINIEGNLQKLLFAGFACCVLVGILVTIISTHQNPSASTLAVRPNPTLSPTVTVVSVNGLAIPVREMNLFLSQERAATFAYFQQQYGVNDNAQFWTTAYGGQTPQDYIKKAALKDIIQTTVQQQLGHQYGLLADPSYGAFVQAWLKENAQRQQALANHQVIYGPTQYTEANYFNYLLSQMTYDLEQQLAQQRVIDTSDGALYPYYLSHESLFQQASTTNISLSQPSQNATLVTPPFTQIRSEVEQKYVSDQYAIIVSNLTGQAKVVIDQAVYNAITTT